MENKQGSADWISSRLGKVTASSLYKVLSKTKIGYGADRKNYMMQLISERILEKPIDNYVSQSMKWGLEQEPFARAAYEMKYVTIVEEVGFINHPTISMAGASPDGLIGTDGIIEIKCPDSKNFIEFLLSYDNNAFKIDKNHFAQMQWQMKCSGRKWCDYVIFDPRLPSDLQLFVDRIEIDHNWLEEAEKEVFLFLLEVDQEMNKIQSLRKNM